MAQKRNLKVVLAAGSLTILLGTVFFAFGGVDVVRGAPATAAAATPAAAEAGSAAQLTQLLQARDAQYRTAIAQANQTIQTLEQKLAENTATYESSLSTLQEQNRRLADQVDLANQTLADQQTAAQAGGDSLAACAAQNGQLRDALTVMQGREQEYRATIETAGAIIQDLQQRLQSNGGWMGDSGEEREHDDD